MFQIKSFKTGLNLAKIFDFSSDVARLEKSNNFCNSALCLTDVGAAIYGADVGILLCRYSDSAVYSLDVITADSSLKNF